MEILSLVWLPLVLTTIFSSYNTSPHDIPSQAPSKEFHFLKFSHIELNNQNTELPFYISLFMTQSVHNATLTIYVGHREEYDKRLLFQRTHNK